MNDYRSKSWWLESLPHTITPNPRLEGTQKADVAVIGGGYTGLSVGYHLKQINPGIDVRIIESDVCGYGASGRNGGFSMTLFGLTKGITKFRFNDEKAKSAHQYMEEAVDYLHEVITQNNIDCDYERSGYLLVGTSPAQVKRIEHDFKIMEKWGLGGVERWGRDRLSAEFNSDFYKVGWFEPRCGIVNPARLARGIKGLAEKSGVVIYEQSPVIKFGQKATSGFIVQTEKGEIEAEYLVFATNAYSILFPELKNLQIPAFTHIVISEPLTREQYDAIGWKCRAGIEDARDLIHYYRLTKDNRIVMGGGDVSFGYGADLNQDLNDRIFGLLEAHVPRNFPPIERDPIYSPLGRTGFDHLGYGAGDRIPRRRPKGDILVGLHGSRGFTDDLKRQDHRRTHHRSTNPPNGHVFCGPKDVLLASGSYRLWPRACDPRFYEN